MGDTPANPLRSRWITLLICIVLTCLAGYLDLRVGSDISVLFVYLVPVAYAGWMGGLLVGQTVTIVAACIWVLAQVNDPTFSAAEREPWVLFWNTLTRYMVFVVVALLTTQLAASLMGVRRSAEIDPLTGLDNRRTFLERLAMFSMTSGHRREAITLVLLDVDRLRDINAAFGQPRGDVLLSTIARVVWQFHPRSPSLARIGSDEFVMLFPGVTSADAPSVVNEVTAAMATINPLIAPGMTLSIVAVTADPAPLVGADLLQFAEAELAKLSTPNARCIVRYAPVTLTGQLAPRQPAAV